MPPVRGSAPPSLARYITTFLVGTVIVAAGALNGLVVKKTPSGASATRNIWCAKSSSGTGLCIREDGSVNASGAYLTNGAATSGIAMSDGDARYVRKSGSTMTGALTIDLTTGLVGLNVRQVASGAMIRAMKSLTSSGTLSWEGAGSGASLYLGGYLQGAGLVDCDIAGTSKLLWDITTGRFSCGSDATGVSGTFGSGNTITIGDTRYVRISGSTMTGTLVLNPLSGVALNARGTISGALITQNGAGTNYFIGGVGIGRTTLNTGVKLGVSGTISGSTVYASTSLRSSGSLVWEGAGSGASLTATTLSGNTIRYKVISPRWLGAYIFATGSTVTTGSGKAMLTIGDPSMSGSYLKSAHLSVQTAGTTNTTSIQIRNASKANCKMLSTVISIDSTKNGSDTAATPYVINSACREIGAYQRLIFDVPSVSTTAPKGDMVLFLEFYKP